MDVYNVFFLLVSRVQVYPGLQAGTQLKTIDSINQACQAISIPRITLPNCIG